MKTIDKKVMKKLSPTIGVYDQNMPSGLSGFYLDVQDKGVKLDYADELEDLKECKYVIINPVCIVFKQHWDKIREYVQENQNTQILFFAPSYTQNEIEEVIGINKNIEYIALQGKNVNWTRLNEFVMENKE